MLASLRDVDTLVAKAVQFRPTDYDAFLDVEDEDEDVPMLDG
jgi:hypothetical protein